MHRNSSTSVQIPSNSFSLSSHLDPLNKWWTMSLRLMDTMRNEREKACLPPYDYPSHVMAVALSTCSQMHLSQAQSVGRYIHYRGETVATDGKNQSERKRKEVVTSLYRLLCLFPIHHLHSLYLSWAWTHGQGQCQPIGVSYDHSPQ